MPHKWTIKMKKSQLQRITILTVAIIGPRTRSTTITGGDTEVALSRTTPHDPVVEIAVISEMMLMMKTGVIVTEESIIAAMTIIGIARGNTVTVIIGEMMIVRIAVVAQISVETKH